MTVSNLTNQLIVPITLWGSKSPTHCVSSIILTNDYRTIITGCNDGQICIWDFNEQQNLLTPRSLLFGHTSAVLCLANGLNSQSTTDSVSPHFVSSSESGEMSLWDLSEGRCIEAVKLQHVHTSIHTYIVNHDEIRFFCNGYYAEILVMNGLTLEILFTLNSKLNPDWISAIHVLKPTKSQDDVVIGLSIAGVMKVWTLAGHEAGSLEPIYENESKPIRCLNAIQLTCCCYNQRTLLIVCAKYWQIYDVGDFALLCSVDNRRGERWSGGDFLFADRVVIWSDVGKAYLYKLPVNKLKGKALSCVPGNAEFHKLNTSNQPFLYGTLTVPGQQRLLCPPAMAFYNLCRVSSDLGFNPNIPKVVVRGDSDGRIVMWKVPEISDWNLIAEMVPEIEPSLSFSLSTAWKSTKTSPCGIIDNLLSNLEEQHSSSSSPSPSASSSPPSSSYKLTSSVYIPALGRLICGREDGSIIIVSANQTIMLQLLLGRHRTYEDWPHHQILYGHSGRVNTLLYPHHLEDRYELSHLISGGVDFSVCLWDIFTGTLLHRFSVHAGEITQMFVPPKDCSPRILNCICSVASDHSVALISLKERRCVMLASRHLFPINTIKWRPLDDFMIVGCVDGSVYVWQMETGHLDRVLHGMVAEEVLSACDGNSVTTAGDRFVNPAIHLFRGLRHRNLAAIRQAAVRGLHNISAHLQQQRLDVVDPSIRARSSPLLIQGLRTNPKDQESHILFFDVESLIVQMLSEEYDILSPTTLENRGLTTNLDYKRYAEMSCSPETQHKLTGFLTKMKDTAENAAQKIQAKAESVGFKNVSGDITVGFQIRKDSASSMASDVTSDNSKSGQKQSGGAIGDNHMPIEIARLLLSLLHAWGLDPDLDKVCELKLGLLRPLRPVCFGSISKGGYMSLLLPTYMHRLDDEMKTTSKSSDVMSSGSNHEPISRTKSDRHVRIAAASGLNSDLQLEEEMARRFSSYLHWQLSTSITTNHLLSLISLANTLMTMSNGTMFAACEASNRRRLIRKLSRQGSTNATPTTTQNEESELKQQRQQIRDGWSLLAALHCILLPDLIHSTNYKRPLVEILARRWQDRCIEIREAAQSLLLAELKSAGSKGRRMIVEEWSPYLPTYDQVTEGHMYSGNSVVNTPSLHSQPHSMVSSPITTPMSESNHFGHHHHDQEDRRHGSVQSGVNNNGLSDGDGDDEDGDDLMDNGPSSLKALTSSTASTGGSAGSEGRRKQATAIILMAVIGAEYGTEIEPQSKINIQPTPSRPRGNLLTLNDDPQHPQQRRRSIIEGFGGGGNYQLARKTSKALSYLLLTPASSSLPYHTSLRRAAIDLIGRGFTVWEPYLDVSKILLALLEFCSCENEQIMVPSLSFGLPLTPAADSCRTARHAISLIAQARPPAFITTLAKEVTRYNAMQQQQQALAIIPNQTVLYRARPQILRNMESLIEKNQFEVYQLIIETTDIVLYALDHNALKNKGLGEMFPAITRFQNVTHCTSSKRVAVGSRTGGLAIYELKTGKSQLIQAHSGPVTACAFAPDGKHLASYCSTENKVSFWLTAVGLFGLGTAQTKCVKSHSSPPMPEAVRSLGPLKSAKLVWVSSKLLILLFADGKEHRFSI